MSGDTTWYSDGVIDTIFYVIGTVGGPLIDAKSTTDAGFTAGHPFTSGVEKSYIVQSALANNVLHYWRVRAIDPSGSNTWGAWATTRSFTTIVSAGGSVIKTVNGLAKASVKTWNGLAIASVKTINGIN